MKNTTRNLLATALAVVGLQAHAAEEPITIAHVAGFTGALEAYTQQLQHGLELGFEYATDGSNEVLGRKIELITKDTQLKAPRARALLADAYTSDNATIAVGDVSSGVALAMLPVAAQYQKILMPEGVADSITGENYNRYIVRVGRNSSQDAISNAAAVADEGVCISTLAQDYAFGRDGVAAYAKAARSRGAEIVNEVYLPAETTDFTSAAQRLFNSLKDRDDCEEKYIFNIWAGKGNPMSRIQDLQPERFDIKLTTGGNILPAMVAYKQFPGMEGATYYYYESPENEVNDWLVEQHQARFDGPPDFFTAQGMSQAMAIVAAIEKAGSTDTEALIEAFEGLEFDSPKGPITIRAEDHQAMQPMYHFRIKVEDGVEWGVPELVDVIPAEDMDIPINNG
ncbi:substrate-binding domain-containing protein [Salinisphaera orenii]|uniref:ABC transporter permease n=1 Tax=Salinisphaera orenii YIM 95161 TaxID=1051139 RepID=A0A423PK42_9GAMM|nr:substrate-binding domain-containing protein [Salinisphaera halophila]ROO25976.1 ABC transporter permease [Salinisphaera halophila YIM 95161]